MLSDLIKKLIKKILTLYVTYLPIRVNGNWLYMSLHNIEVIPFMILGKYETGTINMLKKLVKKNWTVCDIGAYVGDNTAVLSKKVGAGGKVISIEPEPDHFRLLQKNIKLNGLKNVDIHQVAISNKNGSGTIYSPKVNSPDSRLFKLPGELRTGHQVKIRKLDSLLEEEKRTNLIIIDVQGWEEKALSGAKRILTMNKDIILITEFWPEGLLKAKTNVKKFLQLIKSYKFKIYVLNELTGRTSRVENINELIKETPKVDGGFVNLLCVRKPISHYTKNTN